MASEDGTYDPPWIKATFRQVEQAFEHWRAMPYSLHAVAFTTTFVEALELFTTAFIPPEADLPDLAQFLCTTWGSFFQKYKDDLPLSILYQDLRATLARHALYEWRFCLTAWVTNDLEYWVAQDTFPNLRWCLHRLPYPQYLQTRHWKDLRTTMLQQSGYRCQVCNSQGPLRVHHRTYERRGYEHFTDLIVLCKDCHELFHTQGKLASPLDQEEQEPRGGER